MQALKRVLTNVDAVALLLRSCAVRPLGTLWTISATVSNPGQHSAPTSSAPQLALYCWHRRPTSDLNRLIEEQGVTMSERELDMLQGILQHRLPGMRSAFEADGSLNPRLA